MPKGEHFKKVNPRIIQISFKVSDSENDKLRKILKEKKQSIPEFFREVIMSDEKPVAQNFTSKPLKIEKKKPDPESGQQISLF